jgi:hypothetical protein
MISTDCTDSKSNYYTTRLLVCLRNVWRYQKGSLEDVNRPLQSPKNDKRTNNDSPNITQKTKDREKWNPLKTGDELGCSRMINSFWSRCGTCLVTLFVLLSFFGDCNGRFTSSNDPFWYLQTFLKQTRSRVV